MHARDCALTTKQLQVLGFQHLDHVATAVQSAGEPSTGLAFLDKYSIIVLGDLTMVSRDDRVQ